MALKELGEAIDLAEAIAEAIESSTQNEKWEVSDGRFFIPVLFKLKDALKDSHLIVSEIKNANGEEAEQAFDRLQNIVEQILQAVVYK